MVVEQFGISMNELRRKLNTEQSGFTIPEVIVAGSIMIILCVGTLTVFTTAVKYNRGNNLRMQALSVLQLEAEFYRGMKFVPVGTDSRLIASTYTNVRQRTAADGRVFNITVVITNIDPAGSSEADVNLKELNIRVTPVVAETEGWLQNLGTELTLQRVRSN
jgi:type II secretory pathway pseudopilin PulG